FFFHVDHRAYGLIQQARVALHGAAILSFLIKPVEGIGYRFGFAFTAGSDQIQQAFYFGVVVNHLTIEANVNQIVRVKPVVLIDVYFRVTVTQGEYRSEEHTSELQSRENLVCRLLLEKK